MLAPVSSLLTANPSRLLTFFPIHSAICHSATGMLTGLKWSYLLECVTHKMASSNGLMFPAFLPYTEFSLCMHTHMGMNLRALLSLPDTQISPWELKVSFLLVCYRGNRGPIYRSPVHP